MVKPIVVDKLIAGGQTGADRAALDFALEHGISCGGWCPKGRWAEDGLIPEGYPLNETKSPDPAERTGLNIAESDGTLVFTLGEPDTGTKLTLELAQRFNKPYLLVDFANTPHAEETRGWLACQEICTLNVAGPRESKSPGIYTLAKGFLTIVLGSARN